MTFGEWSVWTVMGPKPGTRAYIFAKEAWEASERNAVPTVLKAIAGNDWQDSPFRFLKPKEAHLVIDAMNVALNGTGWYLGICGDGLSVCACRKFSQSLHDDLAKKVFEAM
jgi:hypothetical protein